MGNTRLLRSRYLTAIVLGSLAALVTYLPPFFLAERMDGRVFDLWSRLTPAPGEADIVLVTFDDPAWLTTLVDLAEHDDARLLVTTLAHPPSPDVGPNALGPTELALGPRLVRRTDWPHGGHLLYEADADGIVRSETPSLEATDVRSLAFNAHATLATRKSAATARGGEADAGSPPAGDPSAVDPSAVDPSAVDPLAIDPGDLGELRIRYLEPGAFQSLVPGDLLAGAGQLTDRVVVAGLPSPERATPMGPMSEHELVANVLAGYNTGSLVRSSSVATAAPWIVVLLGLWLIALRPRSFLRRRWLWPLAGGAGLLGSSAAAFAAVETWVPVAGPGMLLLTASVLLLVRPARGTRPSRESAPESPRELLEAGRLLDAWALYRKLPPTQDLFDELYELGAALEDAGHPELAADVFYRIALVDVRYHDVARRLVRATHSNPGGTAADREDRPPPDALGRYEILELIGSGSTGRVFLARDPEINRIVALKVIDLLLEYEPDELEEAKDGFRREAETAGRLSHPNIVTIFDIGETDGLAYIAMEYLKGRHLSDFTAVETLLPVPLVLELGARTAEALDYAHAQNVVHRDIKPSNIMYDSVSGDLKITDFGIARLIDVSRTRTGVVLGTPSFMAPEQLEGKNVNGNTDLFALGVSLYELLTGRLPFRGTSMTTLMFVIANEPHELMRTIRPELPAEIDPVIDVALSKDPDARFLRGAEMAEALRAVARQLS